MELKFIIVCVLIILLLSGCSTKIVEVKVPVKCQVELPEPPAILDVSSAKTPCEIVKKNLKNYEAQKKYAEELLILLNSCR